jgi:putative phage-type endonuclease
MSAALQILTLEQGTPEWLALRKTKVTATDSCVIMGANPWKTRIQLYNEKIHENTPIFVNERMQRGTDLEPIARDLFCIQTGIQMKPAVCVKDWAMASLDGLSPCGRYALEIKCPGDEDHKKALMGKVPDKYYPQCQKIYYVNDVDICYYYSFDSADGVIIEVKRDQNYIDKMVKEELDFFKCLQTRTPPEPQEGDYIYREDDLWKQCATQWMTLVQEMKEMEKREEDLRKQLIFLSGESNSKGSGISLCQVRRKGNIDYSKITELKGIDLEPYRKPSSDSWRITSYG